MDEQFLYDFRTGCGNSAKFVRFFDMGFMTLNLDSYHTEHALCEMYSNFLLLSHKKWPLLSFCSPDALRTFLNELMAFPCVCLS